MRHRTTFGLLALALSATWTGGCASGGRLAPREHRSVLLISIDGLRPEFYRSGGGWDAPTLQRLASQGATADAAEPIFPSLTYPNHATIVTGVRSARHGVVSNTIFSPKEGLSSLWYWNAEHLQAPTIWQRAKAAGYRTAILTWPATVGAQSDWAISEIFPSPPAMPGTTWELMQRSMSPALARELVEANGGDTPEGFGPRDRWVATAAEHILKKRDSPEFTLIHIIAVDYAMHEHGKDSLEARQALRMADEQLARIVAAVDPSRTTVFVVGDHGFYDYDKLVRPNLLFARQGWLHEDRTPEGRYRIRDDWKVIAHPEGGAASVYVRDPKLAPRVLSLLKKSAGNAYRVIGRTELDELEAFPGALCAINPAISGPGKGPGYSVDDGAHGKWIEKLPRAYGNHGPLASDAQLMSGLVVVGPGIAAGTRLGRVRLLDVAPTVARVIDIPLSEAEGSPIKLVPTRGHQN